MVLSMDRWVGKVAIVTGAASGIGAAISKQLVEKGVKVAALDINGDGLDALATKLDGKEGKLYPIKTDVAKEEEILNAFKLVKQDLGPIHILVNNAGLALLANLSESDTQKWITMLQVNVLAPCIATREAIKDMRANNVDGHIIHTNSIFGHQVTKFPYANIYPATKHAITALAETLRLELNSLKSKIKITSISPGLTDTGILSNEFKKDYSAKSGDMIEPEQIADGVMYALSTPPHVQIQELTIRPIFDF